MSRLACRGDGPARATRSSAKSAWGVRASGSAYTATVGIPISRQVRSTRSAISPRLATRTLVTLANCHQHFVGCHDAPLFGKDFADGSAQRGDDVVLHFHRFQHDDDITE